MIEDYANREIKMADFNRANQVDFRMSVKRELSQKYGSRWLNWYAENTDRFFATIEIAWITHQLIVQAVKDISKLIEEDGE